MSTTHQIRISGTLSVRKVTAWWNSLPHHHHHHHVVLLTRISLTLSRHFSLSFIASGRSSGLHPVSSHSCWMHVRAGRPAFVWPYVGVHRSTSLMSSSLLLPQCPACLVRLTWIVFVIGGRWPPPRNVYIYIYTFLEEWISPCCYFSVHIYYILLLFCIMYIYIYIYIYGFAPSYGKLVCLATQMSSDRTKQICLWMTIYTSVGLSSLANEVIMLPLAFICKALHIWIELSVAVNRMYVNNSNCDS